MRPALDGQNMLAGKEHKSQASLMPEGGAVKAPPGGLRLEQVQTLAGVDLGLGLGLWWAWNEVRTKVELGQTQADGLMAAWLRTGPDARRYDTRGQGRSQAWKREGDQAAGLLKETGSRQVGPLVQLCLQGEARKALSQAERPPGVFSPRKDCYCWGELSVVVLPR